MKNEEVLVTHNPPRNMKCQALPVGPEWTQSAYLLTSIRSDSMPEVGNNIKARGRLDKARIAPVHFLVEATGTMMCAYCVPVHITHGPPL